MQFPEREIPLIFFGDGFVYSGDPILGRLGGALRERAVVRKFEISK